MNTEQLDLQAWPVETPPEGFADAVVRAAQANSALGPPSGAERRTRPRPRAAVAIWAAAGGLVGISALAGVAIHMNRPSAARSSALGVVREKRADPAATQAERGADAGDVAAVRIPRATERNRARRAEVEAKLRAWFPAARGTQGGPDSAQGAAHSAERSKAPAGQPRLTKEYITERVRQDFIPLASECYEAALARQPELRGKVVVNFTIVGDASVGGIVDDASISKDSTLQDPEMATCIRESMLSVVFEPPPSNGWVTITYPFEFAP